MADSGLNAILSLLSSDSSVQSLSKKTNTSSGQVSSLVNAALPMLLNSLSGNASTTSGANSLLNALSQHTSTAPVTEQIENADTEDGGKILQHILGKSSGSKISELAASLNIDPAAAIKILSALAPVLLNAVSTSVSSSGKKKKKASSGFDLSDGLGMDDLMALLGTGTSTTTVKKKKTTAASTTTKKKKTTAASTKKKTSSSTTTKKKTTASSSKKKKTASQSKSGIDASDVVSLLTSILK